MTTVLAAVGGVLLFLLKVLGILLLVVLALMGWMLVKVNDRASRVKMPEPDNSLGIYRKADA